MQELVTGKSGAVNSAMADFVFERKAIEKSRRK